MNKSIILTYCLSVLLFTTSCDSAPGNDDAVMVKSETVKADLSALRSEIQELENQWADALIKRDIDALMSLYTEDAKSMQDGGPTLSGKQAIRAQMEKEFAAPPRFASISFTTQDLYGTADELTEVGTSSEKDATGKEIATGKYMAVFQKTDGKYKCVREIYNKDSK